MQVRKLRGDELWRSRLNMAVAFEGDFDWEKEKAKSQEEQAKPEEAHWGAFQEGEEYPCASLIVNRYTVRFDGHMVGLGGVGGVATLPANRRGGAVRACFQGAFREMYDSGVALSALYPFSTGYYQQFGYENSVACLLWNIPLRDLPRQSPGGRVRQLFPGDSLSPLLEVYNAFYGGCNLAAAREVFDRDLEVGALLGQRRYIYLWEDGAGVPGAFLIGSRDGDVLNCRMDFSSRNCLLFRDAQAFTGLMAFVGRAFQANYKAIRFSLPQWADVSPLLPECAGLERSCFFNGMVRAVNVGRLLALCRCQGEGALTLAVTDPLLPENQGTFRLEFAPGRENRVSRAEGAPDITLGVGELTALACGIRGAEELPWMPGVQVHAAGLDLGQVFYHKPCHLLELF